MKLKIVSDDEGRLEMEAGGEGHTLLNLLQSSLLVDKDVEMAGYAKPHPLMDRSVINVHTRKGGSPREALLRSAEDAKKRINEFLDKFNAGVARHRS